MHSRDSYNSLKIYFDLMSCTTPACFRTREVVADCQGICLVIVRFDAQSGPSATVVSLGKKLYSHCLSHPAVKPGTTYIV